MVLMKPRCSVQNGSTGSIFSTNRTGVSFLIMRISLRSALVLFRLVEQAIDVKEVFMKKGARELKDLISIGPAMLRDFELLGIRSVEQLAKQDAKKLYAKLGRVAKQHQDICVLDTFEAAVAQARNPRLPVEKCQWWWWSMKRKKVASDEWRVASERRKTRKRLQK